ncbi:kelch-like protein 24a [Mytilus galloprovincialis]|uniref:kelch-like protein 24a n=1 Tax=Mytilus galloprovincialis TaxID=29158 RepID=UPI003F7C6591
MATYSTDLANGLWKLKIDDKYADFTISINGREFKCHKVILASLSEYFEVMFDTGLEETKTGRVCLDGMLLDEDSCSDLLKFIYTGEPKVVKMGNADILLHVAHMMQIKSLHTICKQFLSKHADKSNCVHVWQVAQNHGETADLAEIARSLILKHFAEIANSEAKLDEIGTVDTLISILESDNINVVDRSGLFCQVSFSWIVADFTNRIQCFSELCEAMMKNRVTAKDIYEEAVKIEEFSTNHDILRLLEDLRSRPNSNIQDDGGFSTPADDVLMVIGGSEGGNNCSVMGFSFPQKIWFSLKPLPLDPGYNFAMCSRGLDIYVSGGSGPGPYKGTGGKTVFLKFDGQKNEWHQLQHLPKERQYHVMYAFDNVYVFGGKDDQGCTNSVLRFNIATNTWISCRTRLYEPVRSPAHTCVGKKVYLFGGFLSESILSNTIQCFNCESEQSYRVSYKLPDFARLNSKAVNYKERMIVVCKDGTVLKCSETDSTRPISKITNFDRKGFGACCFEDKILICGGEVSFSTRKDMMLYDLKSEIVIPMQETLPISVAHFCFTKAIVMRDHLTTECGTTMATF